MLLQNLRFRLIRWLAGKKSIALNVTVNGTLTGDGDGLYDFQTTGEKPDR